MANEDSEVIERTKFMEHIDDGVFVGNKDHILEVFPQYLSYSKEWGGVPKASKFIIYFHSLDAYHIAVSSGFLQNVNSTVSLVLSQISRLAKVGLKGSGWKTKASDYWAPPLDPTISRKIFI